MGEDVLVKWKVSPLLWARWIVKLDWDALFGGLSRRRRTVNGGINNSAIFLPQCWWSTFQGRDSMLCYCSYGSRQLFVTFSQMIATWPGLEHYFVWAGTQKLQRWEQRCWRNSLLHSRYDDKLYKRGLEIRWEDSLDLIEPYHHLSYRRHMDPSQVEQL